MVKEPTHRRVREVMTKVQEISRKKVKTAAKGLEMVRSEKKVGW